MSSPEAEAAVGSAIETLREHMPQHFILLYIQGEGESERFGIVSHATLHKSKEMLNFGIEQVAQGYALGQATSKGEEG